MCCDQKWLNLLLNFSVLTTATHIPGGLQMHSCLMLAVEIMRSFLPAQHLWYVKASDSPTGSSIWTEQALPSGRVWERERGTVLEWNMWKNISHPPPTERNGWRRGTTLDCSISYILIQAHSRMTDSASGMSMEMDLKGYKTPRGSMAEELPLGEWLERLSWDQTCCLTQ